MLFGSPPQREYSYFDGLMLAEKNQDDDWTDYVYANGKKIAKLDDVAAPMIHVHGTTAAGINCGINSATLNYTVKAGDRLSWREYKQNANGGLALFFTDGASTAWAYADTDGNILNQDTASNQWRRRTFVFPSNFVGKTLSLYQVLKDPSTGASTWDVWTSELTLYSTDGTVTPLTSVGIAATGCQGASTNLYSALETTGTAPDAAANTGTHFYLDDHLGTAQMELSSAGWPLWTGQFAPFGQELDTNPTSMRFKFTGKERDKESGLDYFGARYYASNMGRFMSPDPMLPLSKGKGLDSKFLEYVAQPQNWNRYAYTRNNPLSFIDPDGRETQVAISGRVDGNIFGHASIIINGKVYSYGTNVTNGTAGKQDWGASAASFLGAQNAKRSTDLLTLNITPEQEKSLQQYLEAHNPNDPGQPGYSATTNNCVQIAEGALESTGILQQTVTPDPAGQGDMKDTPATPDGLKTMLQNQQGLVGATQTVGETKTGFWKSLWGSIKTAAGTN